MSHKYDLFRAQLFLDDTWIEDSGFVARQWHQPRKYCGPVLVAQYPWEQSCPVAYGTVLYHRDRFKMWYPVWTRQFDAHVCYAQSWDGVNWEKPHLGLCEFEGSTQNNIVLEPKNGPNALIDDIAVVDDADDQEWPLKALYWDGTSDVSRGRGIFAARSRDGIHWDRSPGCVLPNWGDRFNAAPCKIDGQYVIFGRQPGGGPKGRAVWRTASDDLLHWSEPVLVLSHDVEDPAAMQYYSATAFPYGDLLLGSLERMWMAPDKLDPEIIWSHDAGMNWRRARTRPGFISLGQENSWDDTWINLPSNGPIEREGHLWFYYSGRSGAHWVQHPLNQGGIGLALLRIDGFASLHAEESPGWVLTRPMDWPRAELFLNLDPRRDIESHPHYENGEAAVEVRDEANQPVPGFSWDDCEPLRVNTVDKPHCSAKVMWRGRSMAELAGQRLRLAFRLRDTHLYSFRAMPLD